MNARPESDLTCARDSDWCDGVICRERGIDCPNADPVGFSLPGTTDEATCAVCGARLLADDTREAGWRCSREDAHHDPHSWVLVDYDDPDEHEVCSRCGSRRNKHGRLTGAGPVPNCEAVQIARGSKRR